MKTLKLLTSQFLSLSVVLLSLVACHFAPNFAMAQTAAAPLLLRSGVSVGPLTDAIQGQQYYVFNVPVGTTQAIFTMNGGPGDADIYVRYGATPTTSTWTYRPYMSRANETVTVNNPQSGNWYLMVRAAGAYSGVFLKATHNAPSVSQVSTPTFTPASGSYSGQVSVTLAIASPTNATIRFTTDGSTPTEASEVYNAPIVVSNTVQIKAAGYAADFATSSIASNTYTIRDSIQVLTNGGPLTNLSGAQGSVANFRFSVGLGVSSVSFQIAGDNGDADLYVKYGQQASISVWDQRPYLNRSNETVTINTPRAGDYYLMIHAFKEYTGLTIKGTTVGNPTIGKPDITISASDLNPRITTETFAASSCDVVEGAVTAGTRKLLRFTTQSRNIGTADLVLGNPANNPAFEFGPCHGHYHFRSFAEYRLLNQSGQVVRTGRKVGFCLMDITRVSATANPSPRYTCSNQGIQAGWADVYSSNLSGQWIDITGLGAGQYVLEITMDPMNAIDESDETNNTISMPVAIP